MQIHAVQFDVAWEDREANFERVRQMLAASRPGPESLVIFPELFATGYSMNVENVAEPEDRPAERFCVEIARRFGCFILGGVGGRHADGRGLNEAVAYDDAGNQLVRYAKIQPMSFSGERDHYACGEQVVTFRWGKWTVCPLICYDLRFPELFREGLKQGAEMFVVIANWPTARLGHWLTLLAARAIENQAYVVGVNRTGADPNVEYPGRSVVIDPQGKIVADAGEGDKVLWAGADRAELLAWREKFGALRDAGLVK